MGKRADNTQIADALWLVVRLLSDGAAAADKIPDQFKAGVRDVRGPSTRVAVSTGGAARGQLWRAWIGARIRFAVGTAIRIDVCPTVAMAWWGALRNASNSRRSGCLLRRAGQLPTYLLNGK